MFSQVRDPNVKEIIAKESLTYKPRQQRDLEAEAQQIKAAEGLLQVILNDCATLYPRDRLSPVQPIYMSQ